MKQFILNSGPDRQGRIIFTGNDYRYLARVRRLAPGEYFPALLPDGTEVKVQVISVDNKTLTGELVRLSNDELKLKQFLPPIYLFQALPKGEKMDLIVRQAAEGALTEIAPFTSEFSEVKIAKSGEQKFSRWQRIIKEARQQCGSSVPTEIRKPVNINDIFLYWEQLKVKRPGTLGLLFHHRPLAHESLHGYLCKSPCETEAIVIVIGPEGGFSPAEADRFLAAGFKSFTIGDTILRTETAALYAAAAVRIILLERDSWKTMQQQHVKG